MSATTGSPIATDVYALGAAALQKVRRPLFLQANNGMVYKTLSHNLSHAAVAFTMDVSGHVSETVMQNGAKIMQRFIESL